MSRAAAQTVRLCGYSKDFASALFVVNSLHFSSKPVAWQTLSNEPIETLKTHDMEPIDFGQAVSARLAAHSFLHGLVRAGRLKTASTYAGLMIERGIPIRTHTLERILYKLGAPFSERVSTHVRNIQTPFPKDAPQALHLHGHVVANAGTQIALRLLQQARTFGQRRTQKMYDSLIKACLMQGEIIVAALLFAMLVKDWQLRQALLDRAADHTMTVDEPSALPSRAVERKPTSPPSRSLLTAPEPNMETLDFICHRIHIVLDKTTTADDPTRLYPALQALANISGLIDTGQLKPGPATSHIMRLLYSCPKTDVQVYIKRDDGLQHVNAYSYFHAWILRLIKSLVLENDRKTRSLQSSNQPALDTPTNPAPVMLDKLTYNSLLHYALRHRLSPKMASCILEHMCVTRDPPLHPQVATYNILIRAGTILRRSDITEAALQALRGRKLNATHAINIPISFQERNKKLTEQSTTRLTKFDRSVVGTQKEPFTLPQLMHTPERSIKADEVTLSSYVKHLTSTGRPHHVARIVQYLIPRFTRIRPTQAEVMDATGRRARLHELRIQQEQAVLKLGPHTIAALLDGLVKAGRTGMAERLFVLAKRAERTSWLSLKNYTKRNLKPWILSVHAYTSMMQCYAAEARKTEYICRTKGMASARRKAWTHGWERYFMGSKMVHRSRRRTALIRGMRLHSTLHDLKYHIYVRQMFKKKTSRRRGLANKPPVPFVPTPKPDAYFFNAALKLFAKPPSRPQYARQLTRRQCRWRMENARRRFESKGMVTPGWTEELQCVAQDMLAAGYSIPPAYRRLFLGNWPEGTRYHPAPPRPLPRRPRVFPRIPQDKFNASVLQTVKERGLPVRRTRPNTKREHTSRK